MNWKKGCGKLGKFKPLIGSWIANEGSQDSSEPECKRKFCLILNNRYLQLIAEWKLKKGPYQEHCIIGPDNDDQISLWSFTSDGKNLKAN